MHTVTYATITTVALLFFASLALAQDLGQTSSIYCPNLTITLQFGSRDSQTSGQVTELQKFLTDYYDLNPADYVTGYFGRLTRDNVRKFQCERMTICNGDEASTGY
ncbi:MAG: peptidoglycan-binding domain-containing protein, partial [bacterium]|nr:peptidoglycan-binding domain-containing protein [bacterium]